MVTAMVAATLAFGEDKKPAEPAQVPVAPAMQAQIDGAWKDVEIANLRLQLVLTQTISQLPKGAYYDFDKRAFFYRPAPVETQQKPADNKSQKK